MSHGQELSGCAVHREVDGLDIGLEDNMVDGLFICTTLAGCRGCHTPFEQAGVETSDTGTEAVKSNPCCSQKSYSRRVGVSVRDERTVY